MLLGISEDYAIDALLEYDVEPTISTYEFAMNLNNKANAFLIFLLLILKTKVIL